MRGSGITGWVGRSWVEGNKHSAEDKQMSAGGHMAVIRTASRQHVSRPTPNRRGTTPIKTFLVAHSKLHVSQPGQAKCPRPLMSTLTLIPSTSWKPSKLRAHVGSP
jgi:hypothetical protein